MSVVESFELFWMKFGGFWMCIVALELDFDLLELWNSSGNKGVN